MNFASQCPEKFQEAEQCSRSSLGYLRSVIQLKGDTNGSSEGIKTKIKQQIYILITP